jgi:hypothetical protein
MKQLRTALLALLFLAAAAQANAQTGITAADTSRAKIKESVFGLGANFSPLSGIGLSVRQHFATKISWQVAGYFARTDAGTDYSYGAELQYDLILKDRIRFYVAAGTGYYYDDQPDSMTVKHRGDDVHIPAYTNTYLGPTRLGGGFGIETNMIGDDFCIMLNLLFISYQPIGDFQPFGSVGLHYYFR